MSFNGGGLSALGSGVRLKKDLNEQSELWLNVKLSLLVVACCDVFLTVVLLTAIKTGWWALPILGLLLGFLTGFCGLMFAERLRIHLGQRASFILGNLWTIGCFAGFAVGYFGRVRIDPAINALGRQIWSAFDLDWWWYVVGGVLLVLFAAVVKKWKPTAAFVGAEGIALLVLAADSAKYAEIWRVISWIFLVYLWPLAAVSVVLAMKALQEIALPSLEFILKPGSWEEYRELGWLGLVFPRLFGQRETEGDPIPEQVIELRVIDEKGRQLKRGFLPGGPEARAFYDAVYKGDSFTERTAGKNGISRDKFNKNIRDEFLARGWAEWKDDKNPQQGVNLLPEGIEAVEHIALAGTTP